MVEVPGVTENGRPLLVPLKHANTLKIAQALFEDVKNRPGFALFPSEKKVNGKRVYTRPQHCNWWLEAQRALGYPDEVIAALIVYSDVTQLSKNDTQKVWPVVITLGNIAVEHRWKPSAKQMVAMLPMPRSTWSSHVKTQLYQKCMQIILQPLLDASNSSTGCTWSDPYGDLRTVWPLLYCVAGDYPETCKVSCTFQHSSARPCSLCYIRKEDLDDLSKASKMRNVKEQRFIMNKYNALSCTNKTLAANFAKNWSTFPVPSFLWGWRFSEKDWGNPYLALMPDVLHQADVGVWTHIREALSQLPKAKDGTLDARHKWMWLNGRIAGLKLPQPGNYFTSAASVSAAEHRAVMQVAIFILEGQVEDKHMEAVKAYLRWYKATFRPRFHTDESLSKVQTLALEMVSKLEVAFPEQSSAWKLIKVHMVVHYVAAIKRGGLPEEYSTNMYEQFHKNIVKRPYRASNRRQWMESIVKSNQFMQMLAEVESDIHEEREYNSAFYEAETTCKRVFLRSFVVIHLEGSTARKSKTDQFSVYNAALQERLGTLEDDLSRCNISRNTIHVFTGCAIPAGTRACHSRVTHFIRANPSHHGQPWFSHVAVLGEGGVVWYAEVLLLFKATGCATQYAYMQYLEAAGVDAKTSCTSMKWA
ncbi:unnamed protein product [Closterium sp. Yama58-4]|nr:unnamed protein product [Closterium sp. Yama58-4]